MRLMYGNWLPPPEVESDFSAEPAELFDEDGNPLSDDEEPSSQDKS